MSSNLAQSRTLRAVFTAAVLVTLLTAVATADPCKPKRPRCFADHAYGVFGLHGWGAQGCYENSDAIEGEAFETSVQQSSVFSLSAVHYSRAPLTPEERRDLDDLDRGCNCDNPPVQPPRPAQPPRPQAPQPPPVPANRKVTPEYLAQLQKYREALKEYQALIKQWQSQVQELTREWQQKLKGWEEQRKGWLKHRSVHAPLKAKHLRFSHRPHELTFWMKYGPKYYVIESYSCQVLVGPASDATPITVTQESWGDLVPHLWKGVVRFQTFSATFREAAPARGVEPVRGSLSLTARSHQLEACAFGKISLSTAPGSTFLMAHWWRLCKMPVPAWHRWCKPGRGNEGDWEPDEDEEKDKDNGNNGVGNGSDPQPPGNPPVNDGAGTGPGNPGNSGGNGGNSGNGGNGGNGKDNGNNGVGNGSDPQPPGNPPVNDGAGTSPGNPGNKGGANK
ncbi:MAG: hypothetical protein HY815_17770 [Candidatus Riflebacteria bacterium]|nr:hypothetical protein [Candidatus Riflebacteria bacterium]